MKCTYQESTEYPTETPKDSHSIQQHIFSYKEHILKHKTKIKIIPSVFSDNKVLDLKWTANMSCKYPNLRRVNPFLNG